MDNFSLGLIESKCFIGLVEALDCMLKTVDISYSLKEYSGLGLSTVAVFGSTADVDEAIKIAKLRLESMGIFYACTVFSRPHTELIKKFFNDKIVLEMENENKNNNRIKNSKENNVSIEITEKNIKKVYINDDNNNVDIKINMNKKSKRDCNFICSLCPEKDCPERWE